MPWPTWGDYINLGALLIFATLQGQVLEIWFHYSFWSRPFGDQIFLMYLIQLPILFLMASLCAFGYFICFCFRIMHFSNQNGKDDQVDKFIGHFEEKFKCKYDRAKLPMSCNCFQSFWMLLEEYFFHKAWLLWTFSLCRFGGLQHMYWRLLRYRIRCVLV